jgi:hypothetical protein
MSLILSYSVPTYTYNDSRACYNTFIFDELDKNQIILAIQAKIDESLFSESHNQIILVVQTKIDGQIESENKEQVIIVVPTETDIMNHLETNNVQVILVVQTEAGFFARKIPFVMNVPHLKFVMKRP